jgi:hypothetical protein
VVVLMARRGLTGGMRMFANVRVVTCGAGLISLMTTCPEGPLGWAVGLMLKVPPPEPVVIDREGMCRCRMAAYVREGEDSSEDGGGGWRGKVSSQSRGIKKDLRSSR